MIDVPSADRLEAVTDATIDQFPRFAPATRERDPPALDDVAAATRASLDDIPALDDLPTGAAIGVGAGSRGIHDMPTVLAAIVEELDDRGFDPFLFPAMGSHGGATADGQRETLEALGITPQSVGCEIRSSMDTEVVGHDAKGRPVPAATDVLDADAALLANRVKAHTDFHGDVESGLAKMTVIGVGKQRGANAAHVAALDASFSEVIPERASILFENTPVVGGVAVVENANEHAAIVEGIPAAEILDREVELLERADGLMPHLPTDDLDLLVLDEIGKNVSGTGMDTNVVGRMRIHGEPEFDAPDIVRIHVRTLTDETHGNANGIGLADFAHRDAVEAVDTGDTWVNSITGGQPERGRLPVTVPSDRTALLLAFATIGVSDPADLRIARIRNTLEPDDLLVSEPLAEELRSQPDITVGDPEPLAFDANGDLADPLPGR